jgi:hypothetical protein
MALLMVPEVSRTAAARANYGARWTRTDGGAAAQVSGASGANVLAAPGGLDLALRNPGPAPIRVALRVEGVALVDGSTIEPGAERQWPWRGVRTGLLFVEATSTTADGRPAPVEVRVDRR